jgi:methanogenic corrinoid protein MtbC1
VSASRPEGPPGARLSIGALARATGMAIETLRTWESRYGFPEPARLPSGHRVYPLAAIPRLRRIGEALARGHRAGQVVPLADADLRLLLESGSAPPPPAEGRTRDPEPSDLSELLRLVESFQPDRLTHALLSAYARQGPLPFLRYLVAPLLQAVGRAWKNGELQIRHEHFLSERLGDVLRSLRMPFEERATGPLVVLSTLPGEAHGLGLQMAALVLTAAGCRILYLGVETPTPEIVSITRDVAARALALSVSSFNQESSTAATIRRVRARIPKRTALLVGGEGAPDALAGVRLFSDLADLDGWARIMVKN